MSPDLSRSSLALFLLFCINPLFSKEKTFNHSEFGDTIKEAVVEISIHTPNEKQLFKKTVTLQRNKNSSFDIPETACRVSLEISRIYFSCIEIEGKDHIMATIDFNGSAEYLRNGKRLYIVIEKVIIY